MTDSSAQKITKTITLVCATITSLTGLAVIIGWFMGYGDKMGFAAGTIPMAPNTALLFFLLGGVAILNSVIPDKPITKGLIAIVAFTTFFIAGLTLFEILTGISLRIDYILITSDRFIANSRIGRMALITALCFFLLGLVLIHYLFLKQKVHGILATIVLLTSWVHVMGYIYGVPLMYSGFLVPMALPTALSFLLLSLSYILSTGPEVWPRSIFSGKSGTARLMRRIIPVVASIMMFTSWLGIQIYGHLDSLIVLSAGITSLISIIVVILVIEVITRWMNKTLDQAESKLRENEESLFITLQSIGDGVIATDNDGRVTRMNKTAEILTGWTILEAKGKVLTEVFHIINAQTKNTVENPVHLVLKSGQIHGLANHTVLISRKGKEYQIADSAAPIRDKQGNIRGVILVFSDVTEKYAMENEILENEKKFRSYIENAPDGIFVVNPEGYYQDVNTAASKLLGYSREELLKMHASQIVAGNDLPLVKLSLDIIRNEGNYSNEILFLRKDGSTLVGLLSATKLNESHYLGFVKDITERKLAEAELSRMNHELETRIKNGVQEIRDKDHLLIIQSRQAAMGEMIGNIAHQWRQPLNALGILIQKYKIAYNSGKLDNEYIDNAQETSMNLILHMSQTIDDFRNFFKPHREKISFAAGVVLENTAALLFNSLKDHSIELDLKLQKDIHIVGFPNEFGQVLLNLIQNSKEALMERNTANPRIQVRLYEQDGKTIVTIADNAGGIPDSIINQVFEPYFTTKISGTGVGLYMSKMIVEKYMNGKITVENTAEGALFKIQL